MDITDKQLNGYMEKQIEGNWLAQAQSNESFPELLKGAANSISNNERSQNIGNSR